MYYNDYALQKRAEAQQLTKLAYAARGILRMRNAQRAALQKQAAPAGLLPYTLGGAGVGALLGGGSALLGNRDKDTAKRALIRALIGGVVGGGAGVGASFLHGAMRGNKKLPVADKNDELDWKVRYNNERNKHNGDPEWDNITRYYNSEEGQAALDSPTVIDAIRTRAGISNNPNTPGVVSNRIRNEASRQIDSLPLPQQAHVRELLGD